MNRRPRVACHFRALVLGTRWAVAVIVIAVTARVLLLVEYQSGLHGDVVIIERAGGDVVESTTVPHLVRVVFGRRCDWLFRRVVLLRLRGRSIGNSIVMRLTHLHDVETLDLMDTEVTDIGLTQLGPMPKLTLIRLDDTLITDVGLKSLEKYSSVEFVFLTNTALTNEGIQSACLNWKKLKLIDVAGTRVTEDGVKKLRRTFPDVEFGW